MASRKNDYELATSPELDKASKPLLAQTLSDSPVKNESALETTPRPLFHETVQDKYYIVYIIFLLFGISILLPWNIFITAEDYFVKYKLNTNTSENATYRNNFIYYVGNIGQATNVFMNLFNILVTFGGNPKNRIPYAMVLCSVVILFQMILAIINSYDWPFAFFILCCVSVFVMYIATGVLNSCVYYVASIFPMEYVNAIILGNNLSGLFTTMMNILSKASTPDLRLAGIYYFLSSFIVVTLGFIGYFVMHRMNFYKFYAELAEQKKNESFVLSQSNPETKAPFFKILVLIIKKTWLLLFCIWINFFSTLAIFPVFMLGVERSSQFFIIPNEWFQDVVTFVTFNVFVLIGNMIPKLLKFPGPKFIAIPVILRAVFVFVFFAISNYQPDKPHRIPIIIKNDYVYWFGSALSPLLFGYFTSLLMMYTPNQVPEHAGHAAMIAALVLVIGVTTGLQFSKVLEFIVLS